MLHFNEDTRVKFPATIQFLKLGYNYLSLKGARIDFETKIFVDIFKSSLEKINNRAIEDDETLVKSFTRLFLLIFIPSSLNFFTKASTASSSRLVLS